MFQEEMIWASIMTAVIVLGLAGAGIGLQFAFSRGESPWLGLILPALTFIVSLLTVFFTVLPPEGGFGALFPVFLKGNISTAVLMAIYFFCRQNRKKKKQVEKMNIQDLD